MHPTEYSQFLKRWTEKFDPEQIWLKEAGSTAPTESAIRQDWQKNVPLSTPEFDHHARILRNQTQAGLIYRLLSGLETFEDTVRVTTQMAESASVNWLQGIDWLRPDLLIWLPNILFQSLGIYLLARTNRH